MANEMLLAEEALEGIFSTVTEKVSTVEERLAIAEVMLSTEVRLSKTEEVPSTAGRELL
jgi:hypothetical protein